MRGGRHALLAIAPCVGTDTLPGFPLLGRPKSSDELTGLVAGLGPWGVLLETEPELAPVSEDIVWIDDEPEDKPESPWR